MTIRRLGAPPDGRPHRIRPGAYAAIGHRGAVLLVLSGDGGGVELSLPGGGIDPGEQPMAALRREVLEETGWALGRLTRLGAFRRHVVVPEGSWADGAGGPAEKVCAVYAARAVARRGPPTEPGHAAVLMAPDAALAMLSPEDGRAFLARALALGLA